MCLRRTWLLQLQGETKFDRLSVKMCFLPKSQFKKSQHVCFYFHKKATLSLSLSIDAKCSGLENTTAYLPHYCIKYSNFSSRTSWLLIKPQVLTAFVLSYSSDCSTSLRKLFIPAAGSRCHTMLDPTLRNSIYSSGKNAVASVAPLPQRSKEDKKVKVGGGGRELLTLIIYLDL